jgi:cytochrome c553
MLRKAFARTPLPHVITRAAVAGTLLLGAAGAAGAEDAGVSGEAVYRYCENCHGRRGAGGEGGKYPRIAGLPAAYVDQQLHDFKAQRRVNKPMIPIFKHHRFDDGVIAAVASHIAGLPPPRLSLWPYEPDAAAIERFGSRQALAAAGADLYAQQCAGCHGESGTGSDRAPPLVQQYPAYLRKQIADFATGRRSHPEAAACGAPSPAETEALLHHLVALGK